MDTLQNAFNEALLNALHQAFADVVFDKLIAQGVRLTTREQKQLTEYLKSGTSEDFQLRRWRWWSHEELDIEMPEQELESIQERFTEQLPGLIRSTANEVSTDILRDLKRTWSVESRGQDRNRRDFKKRLYAHWGSGIDRLRMLLTIAREFGSDVNARLRDELASSTPALVDTLTRLHARACQVTEEVVCLISAGLADGAMARWRTLHEIALVASLLGRHGEDLAQRYIDHQIVESFKAANDYRACSERLGYEPMAASEFDAIVQAFEGVEQRYGPTFKGPYGWAADVLELKRPTLGDIEGAAELDHLRAHYRMASHSVHANPKGVYFKLGLVEESDVLLCGESNAGLADPGHCAAISLMQVSASLGLIRPNMDSIVILRVLGSLVEEVGDAFGGAHRKLEGDIG